MPNVDELKRKSDELNAKIAELSELEPNHDSEQVRLEVIILKERVKHKVATKEDVARLDTLLKWREKFFAGRDATRRDLKLQDLRLRAEIRDAEAANRADGFAKFGEEELATRRGHLQSEITAMQAELAAVVTAIDDKVRERETAELVGNMSEREKNALKAQLEKKN